MLVICWIFLCVRIFFSSFVGCSQLFHLDSLRNDKKWRYCTRPCLSLYACQFICVSLPEYILCRYTIFMGSFAVYCVRWALCKILFVWPTQKRKTLQISRANAVIRDTNKQTIYIKTEFESAVIFSNFPRFIIIYIYLYGLKSPPNDNKHAVCVA